MAERVVVTGVGVISSVGTGTAAFLDALLSGRSGISPVTTFDTSHCRSHTAAKLRGFDAAKYIDPMKLRRIDAVGRLAVAGGKLALEDAGIDLHGAGSDGIGVVLGSYTAGIHSTVEYLAPLMREGPAGAIPLIFSNTVGNAPASLLALEFGLRGPNVTVSHKEASSLGAAAYAVGLLRAGRVPVMIAGGADDVEAMFFQIHDRFRALSPRDRCDEACRPFDRRRNGFVLGEGASLVVLESLGAARARGARVRGEILGVGEASSPCGINAWPVDAGDLARVMALALGDASMAPDQIDVVFAAANGTPELDRTEAEALARVFGANAIPTVSIKGAIGETSLGGVAALSAAVLALGQGLVPPTVGFEEAAPDCPVDVRGQARAARGKVALINSFASGGACWSIVVRAGDVSGP